MNENETKYREALKSHCAFHSMDSLPSSGDVLYIRVSLKDIFFPIKLYPSYESDRMLSFEQDDSKWDDSVFSEFQYEKETVPDDLSAAIAENSNKQLKKPPYEVPQKNLSQSSLALENVTDTKEPDHLLEYDTNPVGPLIDGIPSRKIILSDPGYGKTTLMKRIALAYASEDRSFMKDYSLPGNLYPILLYGRDLDETEMFEGADFESIVFEMSKIIEKDLSEPLFKEVIEEKAEEGSLLLLVDGLDELMMKNNAHIFVSKLCQYLENHKNVHLIITSRSAVFSGSDQTKNSMIKEVNSIPFIRRNLICPLDDDDKESFIYRWYDVLYPHDEKRKEKAASIIEQLRSPVYYEVDEMTSAPLHLRYVLLSVWESNRLPGNVIELYRNYIDISLTRRTSTTEKEDRMRLLSYLAYHMAKEGKQQIPYTELKTTFLSALQDLDGLFSSVIRDEDIPAIIEEMEKSNCLIRKCAFINNEDHYEFSHLSLEEYLCAYAITRNCSEDSDHLSITECLQEHLTDSAYKEIITFTVYLLDYSQKLRTELIDMMLSKMEEFRLNRKQDSFVISNVLFSILRRQVPIKKETRKRIYDEIFSYTVTFDQIIEIGDYTETAVLEEIEDHIEQRFRESSSENFLTYLGSYAVIRINRLIKDERDPLPEAEKLLMQKKKEDIYLGLGMLGILAWDSMTGTYYYLMEYVRAEKLSVSSEKRIRELILQKNDMITAIASTMEYLTFSGYLTDLSFLDKEVFDALVEMMKEGVCERAASFLLSLFPLSFATTQYHLDRDVTGLGIRYGVLYKEAKNRGNARDAYHFFSNCILLGRFNYLTDDLWSKYNELEDLFPEKQASLQRFEIALKKGLERLEGNPVSAGFYYLTKDRRKAMYCFLAAYHKEMYMGMFMLFMMPVWDDVLELLMNNQKMADWELSFRITEAQSPSAILWLAYVEATEEEFLDYRRGLKMLEDKKAILNEAYCSLSPPWSIDLLRKEMMESAVILAWLKELGCAFEIKESLKELKEEIKKNYGNVRF